MEKVIIYRSQSEAMLDKMLWENPGSLIEPIVLLILAAGIFSGLTRLSESIYRSRRQKMSEGFRSFYNKYYNWINVALTVPLTFLGFKLFKVIILL